MPVIDASEVFYVENKQQRTKFIAYFRNQICHYVPAYYSASKMTYIVSGGALNSTHSLTRRHIT